MLILDYIVSLKNLILLRSVCCRNLNYYSYHIFIALAYSYLVEGANVTFLPLYVLSTDGVLTLVGSAAVPS